MISMIVILGAMVLALIVTVFYAACCLSGRISREEEKRWNQDTREKETELHVKHFEDFNRTTLERGSK